MEIILIHTEIMDIHLAQAILVMEIIAIMMTSFIVDLILIIQSGYA